VNLLLLLLLLLFKKKEKDNFWAPLPGPLHTLQILFPFSWGTSQHFFFSFFNWRNSNFKNSKIQVIFGVSQSPEVKGKGGGWRKGKKKSPHFYIWFLKCSQNIKKR